MVNKFKPGIPNNFSFNVAPVSDLGDYLDEPAPTRPPPRREPTVRKEQPAAILKAPQRVEEAPATPTPPPSGAVNIDVQRTPESVVTVSLPTIAAPTEHREERPRGNRHTGPRREINMSPEALHMSDELLDLIRSGSGQRDTKANELIHALLLLAYEVKDDLDPYALPKRGRWGSPTARAYPLEIKNAILRALLKDRGQN